MRPGKKRREAESAGPRGPRKVHHLIALALWNLAERQDQVETR